MEEWQHNLEAGSWNGLMGGNIGIKNIRGATLIAKTMRHRMPAYLCHLYHAYSKFENVQFLDT